MKTELLVMAAGMGSRFGGLKQAASVGPEGEIILDFSVYDAVKAGFEKAVIVIKKEIEKEFRDVCGRRIEKMIDVEYVFQELQRLPAGFHAPVDRRKPWGTGHAVLCAADKMTSPFLVINADDYYGPVSYRIAHDWLEGSKEMCMIGYRLANTLTENGTVSRGVCEVRDGYLTGITEHTALDANSGFSPNTIVSMNMWGLGPDIFPFLEKEFERFLKEKGTDHRAEFYLPEAVGRRIEKEGRSVRVLESPERWYGVTYREDLPLVRRALSGCHIIL